MMRQTAVTFLIAISVLVTGLVTAAADAASHVPEAPIAMVMVSGASPVAGCHAAADKLVLSGSKEPAVAVNPRNSSCVVAAVAFLAVREGLDPDTALRSTTANLAWILGLADRVGTLKPGLDGDAIWPGLRLVMSGWIASRPPCAGQPGRRPAPGR